MRYLLTPIGSSGDVHPYLGIGAELQRRGHDVVLAASEPFQTAAESLGLEFLSMWDRASFEETTRNPDLWHPARGLKLILSTVTRHIRRSYALLLEAYRPGETILVGHTLAFVTRVLEETQNAPAATLQLAPLAIRSSYDQFVAPSGVDLSWTPPWIKRALWWLADRLAIDPALAPELNRWRAELGLAPVSRIFRDWCHSPQKVIGLFPGWFGPPRPDWPPQVQLTDFPLYDEADLQSLAPEVEDFLAAGDPPVVFTAGTGNCQAQEYFATGAEAVRRAGLRAMLLTRWPEQTPANLPPSMIHVPYAPFSLLLPRCAAIVHHGGIGTTAQSLAAGIPQLIMPLNFDQPDNAIRIRKLGVGGIISRRNFSPANAAQSLRALIDNKGVLGSCQRYRDLLEPRNGIRETCDLLENIRTKQNRLN